MIRNGVRYVRKRFFLQLVMAEVDFVSKCESSVRSDLCDLGKTTASKCKQGTRVLKGWGGVEDKNGSEQSSVFTHGGDHKKLLTQPKHSYECVYTES